VAAEEESACVALELGLRGKALNYSLGMTRAFWRYRLWARYTGRASAGVQFELESHAGCRDVKESIDIVLDGGVPLKVKIAL
jgi:hypothetical protein